MVTGEILFYPQPIEPTDLLQEVQSDFIDLQLLFLGSSFSFLHITFAFTGGNEAQRNCHPSVRHGQAVSRFAHSFVLSGPNALNQNALSSCHEQGSGQTIREAFRFVRVVCQANSLLLLTKDPIVSFSSYHRFEPNTIYYTAASFLQDLLI